MLRPPTLRPPALQPLLVNCRLCAGTQPEPRRVLISLSLFLLVLSIAASSGLALSIAASSALAPAIGGRYLGLGFYFFVVVRILGCQNSKTTIIKATCQNSNVSHSSESHAGGAKADPITHCHGIARPDLSSCGKVGLQKALALREAWRGEDVDHDNVRLIHQDISHRLIEPEKAAIAAKETLKHKIAMQLA
ncbi:nucleic acid binding [Striga asiatica]|uniref:Nucleic acid binding n=1 Tax=Striga asiatica TaxID=4170 RepID=A0A5A7Q253_STRAF|nr:nucleic acid binding [Striga asiatica]